MIFIEDCEIKTLSNIMKCVGNIYICNIMIVNLSRECASYRFSRKPVFKNYLIVIESSLNDREIKVKINDTD